VWVVCGAAGELVTPYSEFTGKRGVLVAGSRVGTGSGCHAGVRCGVWFRTKVSGVQKVAVTGVWL